MAPNDDSLFGEADTPDPETRGTHPETATASPRRHTDTTDETFPAETQESGTDTQARDAERARGDTETERGDAETARRDTETVRGDTETGRGDTETQWTPGTLESPAVGRNRENESVDLQRALFIDAIWSQSSSQHFGVRRRHGDGGGRHGDGGERHGDGDGDEGNLESMRKFASQLLNECSYRELLSNWLIHPTNVEITKVHRLMEAWKRTQVKIAQSRVSLDLRDRLEYKINEEAERAMTRLVQLYQFVRLRKILQDPNEVLSIQATNPNIQLMEINETNLAKTWQQYLTDFEIDIPSSNSHIEYGNISPNMNLNLQDLLKVVEGIDPNDEDADPILQKAFQDIVTNTKKKMTPSDCVLYATDAFRIGLYKGKFDARL